VKNLFVEFMLRINLQAKGRNPVISNLLPMRRGVITYLRTLPQVTNIVGQRIYGEAPPQDAVFPYVRYGVSYETSYDAECISGTTVRATIHAFSKQLSTDEVLSLTAALTNSLDESSLPLGAPLFTLDVKVDRVSIVKDRDEIGAWHGIVSLSILTGSPPA
jgi:hypothetical protein